MAKKRENKFLSFIVIIVIIIFVSAIYIVLSSGNFYQNTSNNQSASSQIYKSKAMKFTINIPVGFQAEEKFTTLSLKNSKGEILLSRVGTNIVNIDDYLNDLDKKNNSVIFNREKLTINNLPAIRGMVGSQKYYFIYAYDWTVFTLLATSESLFGDLDQIAQSFKYTP